MSPFSKFSIVFSVTVLAASLIGSTTAHGTITSVTGANGVEGAGFGIIESTPRNGALPKPFEQDTSVIRDREINSGKTGACGRTAAGGNNDVQSQLAAASSAGLPTASDAGELTMNLHQVNQDGAPYTCEVSTDGGNTFQPAEVTQDVPGIGGFSLSAAKDFPLTMQAPAGTACAGGPNGDACIARCRNPAPAGPFGSCVAFSMGGAAGAANATGAATANATAAAAPAAAKAPAAKGAAAKGAAKGTAAKGAAKGGALAGALGGALGGAKGGALGKILGRDKPQVASARKRLITSRIAGSNSGYWIDA